MNGSEPVRWFVLVSLLAVTAGGTVFATTINVPADYPTIQAAINAAVSGDVVVVAQGTYPENIDFRGKAITVQSTTPTSATVVATTIIDANHVGSVATFKTGEGSSSVLSGFTLRNGSGTEDAHGIVVGGGVYCSNSSPKIMHNTIRANAASRGGGIYCGACSPSLTANTISSNSASQAGGGVYCDSLSSPSLSGNTISANQATGLTGSGGGVFCYQSSPTLANNVIHGNGAFLAGGGIYCKLSRPTVTNSVIAGNSAGVGGGVFCRGSSPPLINDTISTNSATHGGGVYCESASSPTIKNSIIAFSTQGGGLYVSTTAPPASRPAVSYTDAYSNTGGNYVNWTAPLLSGNISRNPLFANAARGDFHEKSMGGRYNPGTASWVIDLVHSPCIDAGDPRASVRFEPTPNGGRINMGAYGNTRYASKSSPTTLGGDALVTAAAATGAAGSAQITLNLTSAAAVQVTVLNMAGRMVGTLPERDLPRGLSTLIWDGRATSGTRVPGGRYLVQVTARGEDGSQAQTATGLTLDR